MTPEQIEGNKIIATWYYRPESFFVIHPELAQFHSSFDWIMLVVIKIQSLGHMVEMYITDCDIHHKPKQEDCIACQSKKTLKEAVYFAVIDFIKWNNQQPK